MEAAIIFEKLVNFYKITLCQSRRHYHSRSKFGFGTYLLFCCK